MFDVRKYLPTPIRKQLRAIRAILSIRRHGRFSYFNQEVFASTKSVVLQRILREGIFEPDIVDAMLALSRNKSCVIDVGANIGVMSVALLATKSDIHCISIECSPSTLPYLKHTHRTSVFKQRWTIVESAASDREDTLTFYTAGADHGAYDGLANTGRGGTVEQVQVAAKTLDRIWRDCGSPDVSLVKIDIEGGETSAIRGATELIRSCRPAIIFEWNCENLTAYGIAPDHIFNLGLPEYDLIALPSLVKVEPNTLVLHMRQIEMFAAIPKSTSNESGMSAC